MLSKSHNYGKLWINRIGRTTRTSAYAYWLQASRFEKQARERGDTQMVNYQKQIRLQYQNELIAMDATEGGNI